MAKHSAGGENMADGGRISPALVRQVKARTGIETDTDLIEFALANLDPGLDLGL